MKKKKIGAFGAGQFSLGTLAGGRPGTTSFQNPGGRGGWGVSHTRNKDRARPPPRGCTFLPKQAPCAMRISTVAGFPLPRRQFLEPQLLPLLLKAAAFWEGVLIIQMLQSPLSAILSATSFPATPFGVAYTRGGGGTTCATL